MTVAREETVLDWLTAPGALDTRMATATGTDIVALLTEAGHGHVSERTGRRILSAVRDNLGELAAV